MTIAFESRKNSCNHFGKGSIFEDISCMTCGDCRECNNINGERQREHFMDANKKCIGCDNYDHYECRGASLCLGHIERCNEEYCSCMNHCITCSPNRNIRNYKCKRSIRSQYGDVYEKNKIYLVLHTDYAYFAHVNGGWWKMFESSTIFEDYFEEIK